MASESRIIILDPDPYTGPLLAEDFRRQGYLAPKVVRSALQLSEMLRDDLDLAIINIHLDQAEMLSAAILVKQLAPGTPVVVLASPGPAARLAEQWSSRTQAVDAICRKPIDEASFAETVKGLLERRSHARELQKRSDRLAQRLPTPARDTEGAEAAAPALDEMAVLVSDVRNSTGHIWSTPPREYFRQLNRSLSDQAEIVRNHGGVVLKFLGDGLLAAFRGSGRHHLAVRCAVALRHYDAAEARNGGLRTGVGAAEGLVLSGYLGDRHQLHYDIIGTTVHLAARLCGLADAGNAMLTARLYRAARLEVAGARQVGAVAIRGVERPVPCVALDSDLSS